MCTCTRLFQRLPVKKFNCGTETRSRNEKTIAEPVLIFNSSRKHLRSVVDLHTCEFKVCTHSWAHARMLTHSAGICSLYLGETRLLQWQTSLNQQHWSLCIWNQRWGLLAEHLQLALTDQRQSLRWCCRYWISQLSACHSVPENTTHPHFSCSWVTLKTSGFVQPTFMKKERSSGNKPVPPATNIFAFLEYFQPVKAHTSIKQSWQSFLFSASTTDVLGKHQLVDLMKNVCFLWLGVDGQLAKEQPLLTLLRIFIAVDCPLQRWTGGLT